MSQEKVSLVSPGGDKIDVEWTGERLIVIISTPSGTPGLGSKLLCYDSHVARLAKAGLLDEPPGSPA